jgi:Zn-dependent protease with chaperone function
MNRYVVRVGNLRRIGNPPACSVQNTSIRRITNPPQATSLHYMILALLFMLSATSALAADRKELKPGFNFFSVDQDVQMGREAAAEVNRTMPVIQNQELTGYLTRISQRLAKSKRAGSFPFSLSVINDPSINAFALPGGPIFVHTALLTAADNESQVAGVLAHEMSHVALRHGTHEASKQNLLQLPAMLAGSMGGSGLWAQMGQIGVNLAAGSVLLHMSRSAESEADLNGTRMMNDAGYDPHEMAKFFEKLRAQGEGGDSRLANFLSDHPTPGNRIKAVDEEIQFLPQVTYSETEPATLARVKTIVAALPAPPKPQPQSNLPAPSTLRPSRQTQVYQGSRFSISYPANWQAYPDRNSSSVTFAAKGGLIPATNGQVQIGYGVLSAYYPPASASPDLRRDTGAVVNQILESSPKSRRVGSTQSGTAGGRAALITQLESPSAFPNEAEADMVVTTVRPEGLLYFVFVAPKSEWASAQEAFNEMLDSLR